MIELSCDLGEATTPEQRDVERKLWSFIDAASVACGGHVGNEESMAEAVALAKDHGVLLGAHPSYPDRENFGRSTMTIDPVELRRSLIEQIATLRAIALQQGVRLARVKPHGALYNEAQRDEELARLVVEVVETVDRSMSVVALPGSRVEEIARRRGLGVVREVFADRRYTAEGTLLSRSDPRSLLLDFDEAAAQVARIASHGEVVAVDGTVVKVEFDTICVHGDMKGAVERVTAIRTVLGTSGHLPS